MAKSTPPPSPAKPPVVRVALVDDSELVRIGLRTLLGLPGADMEIVAEAANVADAVARIPAAKPDVVLLDMRLPDGNGVQVCRRLMAAAPGMRVLFLTSSVDDDLIADSIRAGATGYLLKEVNGQELIRAIRSVASGGQVLDATVSARLLERLRSGPIVEADAPTAQDMRILALLSEGKTNKEIGAALGLAEKTIKNQLTVLFDKLGIDRRAQAAAYYVKHHGQGQ